MKLCRVVSMVLLVVLSMTACVAAADSNFRVTAAVAEKAPVLDGVLNDAVWLKASQFGGKVVVDQAHTGDSIAEYPRVAYVAYDDKALYAAFVNFSPDPQKLAVSNETSISSNDEIEMFLQFPGSSSFVQLMVDAAGRVRQPDYGLTFAIKKTEIKWVIEIAVPWEQIGATPKAGDIWKVNFNGHQVADGDIWVCWSPTFGGFKNPDRFGEMQFGE